MTKITWTHPGIARILDAIPTDASSLIDVGCGPGIIGALCRIYRSFDRQVGVDGYAPVLELCRRHAFYDELVETNLTQLPLPFADQTFDVATCVEVIEHLPRTDGLRLLAELERIGKTVVITTPNGFLEQDDLEGNPLQRHHSAWTVGDFTSRGFHVLGIGGMRILGKHRKYLSSGLGPITRYVPQLSEFLLAVKSASNGRASFVQGG